MKISYILAAIVFISSSACLGANDRTIVVHGEYPVLSEVGEGRFEESRESDAVPLIAYDRGRDYKEKAFIAAIHFLSANVYGYTFFYQPSSMLMKQEEVFELELKGTIPEDKVQRIGEGVYNNLYRVKIEFRVTPSVEKWLSAFHTNNLRLTDAEGTSEFYTGFSAGRSDAYLDALKNLVLVTAKNKLSSKPLSIKGDILLEGNPEFSVGAGRYYCSVQGFVNFVEVITYQ
jgi:hypothetical protein